jgi:glutamate racemase
MIGVFDSGLGGLSVLRELINQIPNKSFHYYADSGYCPYGNKPVSEVIARSELISQLLIDDGAEIIVVACNSATAAAIEHLRQHFEIPFVGIEPAIKQAALHTESGKVGVLATENTFNGKLFKETTARYASDKNVFIQVGHGLVEIVEEGRINHEESIRLLQSYIKPMLNEGIDQLVLGCTHYPFLIDEIRKMVPESLKIHDPAPAVARQANRLLVNREKADDPIEHKYFSSGSLKKLIKLLDESEIPYDSVAAF